MSFPRYVATDCTLPMTPDDSALALGHTNSGGEEISRLTGSKVVKAFNTVASEFIAADRSALIEKPDVLIASDHTDAKILAGRLVRDAGFEPVDAGGLQCARYLEPLAVLVGQIAYVQSSDPRIGYRFVRIESNG